VSVLYLLVPLALLLAGLAVWGFVWAARRGQYDDVHTPALRMLQDDEEESTPHPGHIHIVHDVHEEGKPGQRQEPEKDDKPSEDSH
jgi:cbb3-type cytochrome oxidase maturation protein